MTSSKPKTLTAYRGVLAMGLGTLLLIAPATTFAQDAEPNSENVRYKRKSGKVKAKATLDTKFKQEKQKAERDAKKEVDMMSADEWARKKEAVTQEIADKQIGQLKRLIRASEATDAEYPDYLFRLSDHYLDKKAYFELQAGALFDKIYAAEDAQGNVFEWTDSLADDQVSRIVRGGDFTVGLATILATNFRTDRDPFAPDHRHGFRCARTDE